MGEVVNLRNRRKARARADDAAQAAANRVRFGRTLHERRLGKAVKLKRERDLDGRRIESKDEP